MAKHKHISVKSYYHRAKVFAYLAIIAAIVLGLSYLFDKFFK